MKKVLALLFAVMMLAVCMPALSADTEEPTRDNGVGYDLSAVHAGYLLSNGQVSTTDFFTIDDISSHTITIINFWSHRCSYCLPEMPFFQYVHENYPDVLMVGCGSTMISGTQSGEASYFANQGFTYMSVFQDSILYNYHYPNGYLPQTAILNSEGVVIEVFEGGLEYQYELVDRVEYWLNYYTPPTYEVSFVDGVTNRIFDTQYVVSGGTPTYPTPPEHTGYQFWAWDPATPPVITGPTTIRATYRALPYVLTILYVDTEGNTMAAPVTVTYPYGTEYSITSPVIPGFTADIPVVTGVLKNDTTVTVTYTEDAPPVTIVPGDVDGNTAINMADLALAASFVQNSGSVTPQGILNGDINGDGALTAADLASLYSLILG